MTTETQNIPTGYKQTEIGTIPVDWDVKKLGELFEITSSKRVFQSEWKTHGIPFYRARELAVLSETGFVDNELFISPEMYQAFKSGYGVPQVGDILVTGVGTLGKVYVVLGDHDFYFKDGNIIWFKVNGKVESNFLKQLYLTRLIKKQIEDASAGTTVGTYTITGAKKTTIPYPPLNEQTAIAEALGGIDVFITKLETLIEKKKNIKQGAMQELLTGKRRLPGFSGAWEKKTLGQVLKIKHGKSQKNVVAVNGKYPILASGGEIGRADEYLYNRPSVLIGRKGTIDIPQYMDKPFWTVDTLFYSEITEENEGKFIFYKFQLINWYLYNEASGVPSLNAKTIERIETHFPPTKFEQTSIVNILSDLDIEIEKLESQLTKYQNLKQGMMQVLLTGKIRLI